LPFTITRFGWVLSFDHGYDAVLILAFSDFLVTAFHSCSRPPLVNYLFIFVCDVLKRSIGTVDFSEFLMCNSV